MCCLIFLAVLLISVDRVAGGRVLIEHPQKDNFGCVGNLFEEQAGPEFSTQARLWNSTDRRCLYHATYDIEPEDELIPNLLYQSRTLPPFHPTLNAFDWTQSTAQQPPGWPFELATGHACPRADEMIIVKIHDGIIYANFPHNSTKPIHTPLAWRIHREVLFEMIMSVMWLYKDLPNMEFAVNPLDRPIECNLTIPFLQFAVFNQTSVVTGKKLDIDPLEYACPYQGKAAEWCKGYTKGFTLPVPDAWAYMSLSRRQLLWYSYCLHQRYTDSIKVNPFKCNVPRKPKIFWRGSATGTSGGWPASHSAAHHQKYTKEESRFLWASLLKQRVSLSLIAGQYPWMDVGVNELFSKLVDGFTHSPHNEYVAKVLNHLLVAEPLHIEHWMRHHLVLNIDGHGPAFRLPRLLLGTVPVVKVESVMREWFSDHAIPGVHYESVRHDLSDIAIRTQKLLQEAEQDSSRLEQMATKAIEFGVERFNVLSQIESVAWSLARMAEQTSKWQLSPLILAGAPGGSSSDPTKGWYVVKLPKNRYWHSPFLRAQVYKEEFVRVFHHNFE